MNHRTYDDYVRTDPPLFADLRALFEPERVDVLFDVGACEGEDSLRYMRLFANARIFSFEPLPANQSLIKGHFERHQAVRCELIPVALAEKNGTATLHVSSGSPEIKTQNDGWNYGNKSSSLLQPGQVVKNWIPWLEFKQTQEVRTQTLDDFCLERGLSEIDFIHIDVQGAEWLVLQGAGRMLPRVKCIWVEVADAEVYKGQRHRSEVETYLAGKGFRPVRRVCNGLESDMLFVNLRWKAGFRRWLAASVAGFLNNLRLRAGHLCRRMLPRK